MSELRIVKDEKKVEIEQKIEFIVDSSKMNYDFGEKLAKFCLENSKNVEEFKSYSIIKINSFKYF